MRPASALVLLPPLLVVWAALTPAFGQVQAQAEAPRFRNLQVLPDSTSQAQLDEVMRGFTAALGVRCGHCHVGRGRERDFAADDNPAKDIARSMMHMVAGLNQTLQSAVGPLATTVECFTCHRGATVPRALEDLLRETIETRGVDAAVERYRELRGAHYGRARYDFGEATLVGLAGELAAGGDDDGAIEILRLNLAEFPTSTWTLMELSTALHRTGSLREARMRLEAAAEIEPDNRWVQRRLHELFGEASP